MENSQTQHVVVHTSVYNQDPLTEILEAQGYCVITGHLFAEIKQQIKEKDVVAVFAVIGEEDASGIDFLRSMMEFFPVAQRVVLSEEKNYKLLKKAINRSHIDYLLSYPIEKTELETYLRKIPRRYNRLYKPFEKFNVLSEVTEDLLNQNEKFRAQATSDTLTKLLNRRSFDSVLQRFWKNYSEKQVIFCVALLDLDFFKKVNDTYGHTAGDNVLREVGNLLNENRRTGVDFSFRYGGEEFAILSSATKLNEMQAYVQRLIDTIRKTPIDIGSDETIHVTASAGISSCNLAQTAETLLEQADNVLYKAKDAGRDRVVVYC